MPDPIDLQDTVVKVSVDQLAYATIANVTGYQASHGTEGESRRRVFGQTAPHIRPGELVDSYTINGLYDPADTEGQNILRTARDNGTNVFVQVLPDGGDGYEQECRVTEYSDNGDADGDYVECSFTAESVDGTTTPVVGV